ncbi:MAG: PorT family protein [Candidatus Azobacteroides sp.]|nr:PorT family protein [Candidatus Azobacteroides sp.]
MKKTFSIFLFILCGNGFLFSQTKKVETNPFVDQRLFHLGFMVGMNAQDLNITHAAYTSENGETWFTEIPDYSPGFSVGIIGEMYLHRNFSLRTVPSLHFGEKQMVFRESNTGAEEKFAIKSNYFTIPVDLKISANRLNNYRPYLLTGVGVALDLTKKNQLPVQLNPTDFFFEIGVGCDFYFPFFKLIPEIKFCIGFSDVFNHEPLLNDTSLYRFTNSVAKATSQMIVVSFNFE